MTTLPNDLRNDLSRVIVRARELAEAGARVALEALAVHHHEPYGNMDAEARALGGTVVCTLRWSPHDYDPPGFFGHSV